MKKLACMVGVTMLVALLATGCANKKVVSQPDTTSKTAAETKDKDAKDSGVTVVQEEVTGQEIARSGEDTQEMEATLGVKVKDVYFEFDSYAIRSDAKPVLSSLSDFIINSGSKVIIEGHCDERGTNQYNIALGDRRAASIKDFLIASGVSPNKIETVSYGEEKPQCSDQDEACWSINRRGHFVTPK